MAQSKRDAPVIAKDVAVEEGENYIGVPMEQELSSADYSSAIRMPIGFNRKAKVGKEDCNVVLRHSVPPIIEPDEYYPVCEWRIGSEDLDNADNWPQYKRLPLMVNGKPAMQMGRSVMVSYYVIVSVEDVPEVNPHERQSPFRDFHIKEPFSDNKIQMTDFGLPVIKGSAIIAVKEAKEVLRGDPGFGAIRRRGQDTSGGAV